MGIILIEMFRNIMGAGHWTKLSVPGPVHYNSAIRDNGVLAELATLHVFLFNPFVHTVF